MLDTSATNHPQSPSLLLLLLEPPPFLFPSVLLSLVSSYIAQASLKLKSTCLGLQSARITGKYYHM